MRFEKCTLHMQLWMCTIARRIIVNKSVMRIIMDCKLAYHITSN